jgi:hypothetical protein
MNLLSLQTVSSETGSWAPRLGHLGVGIHWECEIGTSLILEFHIMLQGAVTPSKLKMASLRQTQAEEKIIENERNRDVSFIAAHVPVSSPFNEG